MKSTTWMMVGAVAALVALSGCGSQSATGDAQGEEETLQPDEKTDDVAPDLGGEFGPCGDGTCDHDKETCKTCPADCNVCPAVCGDGLCTDGQETCEDCKNDCGPCPAVCGDGECSEGQEDCETCPKDCGQCCGDGTCAEGKETCLTCPADCECPPECGDDKCDEGEDCVGCPEDCECPPACPNGTCEPDLGEDCISCPDDCPDCPDSCGNGTCEPELDEDCKSCEEDCDVCPNPCGNGTCELVLGEDCNSCPEDCTCVGECGDSKLQPESGEECDDGNTDPDDGCDEECALEAEEAEPGAIIITEIMRNPVKVDDKLGEWFEVYNTTEYQININGWEITDGAAEPDHHKIVSPEPVLVPGDSQIVLARNGDFDKNGGVTPAYVYGDSIELANKDDELILSVNGFEIDRVEYDYGANAKFPTAVGKSMALGPAFYQASANNDGANWCAATETFGDGDYGTPGTLNSACGELVCGDKICSDSIAEDCDNCPGDCGLCSSECGNTICESDGKEFAFPEDCDNCPGDCGECCGNQVCDKDFGETCLTCTGDCGDCCGNKVCESNLAENCNTCPDDCTNCCPDGTCSKDESCGLCAADCGLCCPNGTCDGVFGETCATCEPDCGKCDVCGDTKCNGAETCATCPGDCGGCCPNNVCDPGETCQGCPQDCDPCCGNTLCEAGFGETCLSCPQDCKPCCGNGLCDNGEDCKTCVPDCGQCVSCGDKACNGNENCNTCPGDCGPCCGNKACEAGYGETCTTCPGDCGACPVCGDSKCNGTETCTTCPGDCGACPVCGDSKCNGTETCTTCPGDCGACPVTTWCSISGNAGATVTCKIKLAAENAASSKATAFQFILGYDPAKVTLEKVSCMKGTTDNCDKFTKLVTGHKLLFLPAKGSWAGSVKVVAYFEGGTPVNVTEAYLNGAQVVGNPDVMDLVFKLSQNIPAGTPLVPTLTEISATDKDAKNLGVQLLNGILVTSAPAECGDSACNGTETCTTCPGDCGACPACGDTKCNGTETCTTCPGDCGACPVCGDTKCNGTETCTTCPGDCGACPASSWCSVSGNAGTTVKCQIKLAAENAASPKATALQFTLGYDSSKVTLDGFSCLDVDLTDYCYEGDMLVAGHGLSYDPAKGSWAGAVNVGIVGGGAPTPITPAYMNGAQVVGDPYMMDAVFKLKVPVAAGTPVLPTLTKMVGSTAVLDPLTVTLTNGMLVTAKK
jgi:hypothetical protein